MLQGKEPLQLAHAPVVPQVLPQQQWRQQGVMLQQRQRRRMTAGGGAWRGCRRSWRHTAQCA
jgi:hypothetical protein